MQSFKVIDVASFQKGQAGQAGQAGENPLVVDVRTDAEVAHGKIAGALHIPLNTLPMRISELEKSRPIVFYCQSGGRSSQACQFAVAQGFGEVYNLQGGISAWRASGNPTSSN